ncbi:MAG: beta-galactosidase [Lachnospiraceae bacterium]|nr:beta-galactosidase [Lachnospiraceae bacterium]
MDKILYGGDYNPEQWPEDVWEEDMRMLKDAGVDVVTLNVFSWATLQPSEHIYNFKKLDKIMQCVTEAGMKVCLATSTAAHPAWMAKRHPDILQVDFDGHKRKFGARHNSCPCSPTYRRYSARLAGKLAKRYRKSDNIVAWHVSNEYSADCYCENCEKNFRKWLKRKYKNIDSLNRAWNTAFWGHTFYHWNEIVVPNNLSEHFGYTRTCFQGISLDYRRFQSDMTLNNYKAEYAAIKKYTPNIPVTTNFMAYHFQIDQRAWAPYLDFAAWDNYPACDSPEWSVAMWHDVTRGLKGGRSFWLMEQTPSVSNWNRYCALKRPGEMRELSYQAVAHGADTVMFFQMRRSIGACEKYHGAIIDHVGTEDTRVFRECAELGNELKELKTVTLAARTNSRVAILFDWENWWAISYSAGPTTELKYPDEVKKFYRAFYELHIPVDIIGCDDDLSKYDLVIAPVLYMVKGNYDAKISDFVKRGGHFVTTFFSGYVNENDLVTTGGYPGKLRDILGIWVEEIDALPAEKENHFTWEGWSYPAKTLCDLLHTESAEVLATYNDDFYAGMPALTVNDYGDGKAYYIATSSDSDFYYIFFERLAVELNIPSLGEAPKDVELTFRSKGSNNVIFALNHSFENKCFKIWSDATDLLTGEEFRANEEIWIGNMGVRVLKTQ